MGNKRKVCAIVLAAGASTRMKTQKMLLPFKGKTIIETVVDNALKVTDKVVVVLGSHKNEISEKLNGRNISLAINENYLQGMLSSVICGFQNLPENIEAALLFLGDQPQVPCEAAEIVRNEWKNSEKGIVIPTFSGKRGHPVLIETRYKNEIEKLDPEKGLRQLMEIRKNDILEVDCQYPEILRDIDTPEEYNNEIKIILNQ
ncbi:MAG: NTP transferase domain-containing protein [Draconibacterium sp.]